MSATTLRLTDDATRHNEAQRPAPRATKPARKTRTKGTPKPAPDPELRETASLTVIICAALSDSYESERESLQARTRALAEAHPLYPQLSAATV